VPLVCRLLWPWKRLAAVQPGLSEPLRTVILATPIVVDNKVLDFQEWGTGEGLASRIKVGVHGSAATSQKSS